jgi:hypothetical protein
MRFCRRRRLHIYLAAVVAAVCEFEGDESLVFLEVASRSLRNEAPAVVQRVKSGPVGGGPR